MSVQALQQTAALAFDPEAFLSRLHALDELLVARGFHRMSDWWREQIARFVRALAAGQGEQAAALVRRWVIRAGRRSGKSSTLARLAVAWALWAPHNVPAGDLGVVAFVSVSRDEASARLRTIAAILDALNEPYRETFEELELTGKRRVAFKVFSCSARTAVGFTSIMVICDEAARWENRDGSANPMSEVVASLAPSMATQRFAFMVLSSSPWSSDDGHAVAFDRGNDDHQLVSFGPTWLCNPSLTEQRTHELEPDPRLWAREYAAQPGAVLSAALDAADLEQCYRAAPHPLDLNRRNSFVAIDASSLRGDGFTYLCGADWDNGNVLVVSEVGGWEGAELRETSMRTIVNTISNARERWNAAYVFGDQREEAALTSMFAESRSAFRSYAWSESSKDAAFQLLRRLMRERRIILPNHPQLRRELQGLKARLLPSGRTSYQTNGLDFASALVTLAHAIIAGDYSFDTSRRGAVSIITMADARRAQARSPYRRLDGRPCDEHGYPIDVGGGLWGTGRRAGPGSIWGRR